MVPIIPISIFLLATAITGTLTRVLPWLPDCSRSDDEPYPGDLPVRPWPIVIRPVSLPDIIVELTTPEPERPLPSIIINEPIVINVTNDKNLSQLIVNEDGLEKAASHAIELMSEQKEIGDRIAAELYRAVRVGKLLRISKQLAKEENQNPRILNYSILSLVSHKRSNEEILLNIIDVLQDYRKNRCERPYCEGIRELKSAKVVHVSARSDSAGSDTQVTWLKNDQLRTNKKLSDIQREHGVPEKDILESGGFSDEAIVLDRSVKLAVAYAKELKREVQLYPLVRLHPYVTRRNTQDRDWVFGQIAFVLSEVSTLETAIPDLFPFAVLVVDFPRRQ